MYPWEHVTLEQVRDECGIDPDWKMDHFTGVFRLLEDTSQAASDLAELTGHDREELFRALLRATAVYELPEDSRALTFTSPDGEQRLLTVATPRDQKMGTKAYLSRLDLDQVRCARDEADAIIKAKTEEPKRTIWRVCDDLMCRGNFRDTQYMEAVEFMAEQGKKLYAKHGNALPKRARDLQLELVPLRVPESEYESWFE